MRMVIGANPRQRSWWSTADVGEIHLNRRREPSSGVLSIDVASLPWSAPRSGHLSICQMTNIGERDAAHPRRNATQTIDRTPLRGYPPLRRLTVFNQISHTVSPSVGLRTVRES
jgi:hypothetical protein